MTDPDDHRCPGCFSRKMLNLCVREAKRDGRKDLAEQVMALLTQSPSFDTVFERQVRALCAKALAERGGRDDA